jgi:hypothetical protein
MALVDLVPTGITILRVFFFLLAFSQTSLQPSIRQTQNNGSIIITMSFIYSTKILP